MLNLPKNYEIPWKPNIWPRMHQNEYYALWEVIEFGDFYQAPPEETGKGFASETSAKKKGRTLRFSKYETAQELRGVILKTFGGNEATKKTKKNQLKQQYGNFKAEGSETLEQTFNRLQPIMSHLEFMDVEIKQDDLNHKFLTSLAPEWLIEKGKVHTASVPTASTQVSTASIDVAAASISHDTVCAFIASQSNGSQIKYKDITQIDEDDIEEIDIKWNMALLSMRDDRFWKKTSKKITIQGSDVAGFDKSKVECFNCHKMGHFARECRAPRSQDRGKRESYRQGPKEEEQAPKALMAIDEIGWDWSYMANEEENHALVEARLVEFKAQEIKFCKKIRGLERDVEVRNNKTENLMNELEQVNKEKEGLDNKLIGFETALKDLDTLLRSQRTDKNKEGLGYSVVPPPAQVYSPSKKNMSWTGLPEFADDTVTDYSRPTPSIDSSKSNTSDLQNSNSSVSEHEESSDSIMSKPMIKFVKAADSPKVVKTNKIETARKSPIKYAEMYRNTSKSPKVRGKSWPKKNFAHKNVTTRAVLLKTGKTLIAGNSQNNIDDKGYWDSGCSRHMTGNISYISEYEPYDGGYVSFRQGGGKITGKGIIITGKLEFENVYFVKELKYNLFSVSQICDNKNSVLFIDSECIVLGKDFKLKDDTNVLLKTPRQHNMYSIDLNNVVPHKNLTCLIAKASVNEIVTDDFSRFTWTFFLRTKDETSGILRNFITEIENLKDLKVEIIRCDNGGEFKNKEMNEFCTMKGIKREFSNARTPQQNGIAERRNRTLIEVARTMLADAKLPVTFWAGAVNTACYVQNRVLVNKSQNKTLYELFHSRTHAIGFLRPFGCHVMILNTLDHLGKFDAKRDEAFRVFNKRTKKVEENLHVDFLENKLIERGAGHNWLFDIDTLTNSMNYVPVVVAGTSSTNISGFPAQSNSSSNTIALDSPYLLVLNTGTSQSRQHGKE
nr:hypothetical protein [Tanacetum cinerariifolium]